MQKWEYCLVRGIDISQGELSGSYPTIMYFEDNGLRVEEIKGGYPEEGKKLALLIAKLGKEGWELVDTDNDHSSRNRYTLFFKRPIE